MLRFQKALAARTAPAAPGPAKRRAMQARNATVRLAQVFAEMDAEAQSESAGGAMPMWHARQQDGKG